MPTIPSSLFVSVVPSVLGAGGSELDANAVVLTTSNRVPLGSVYSFSSPSAVAAFFGAGSIEARIAGGGDGYGSGYFGGYAGSDVLPGALLFAQFAPAASAAYLRGGNVGAALSLAQLQALTGSLNIAIDGVAHNAASIDLSGAASFSAAAALIQTGINGSIPSIATGASSSIAPATFSVGGYIAGNVLNVTSVASGTVVPGAAISGTGVTAGTKIGNQLSGVAGGVGTYSVDKYQAAGTSGTPIGTISGTYGTLTVGGSVTGTWAVGQTVSGGTTAANTIITALGTGTGGTGTYIVNLTQTVTSGALTGSGTAAAVAYDSVSGAFIVTSGNTGAVSTIDYATGTLAASLLLTSATGAVLQQGAAAQTPAAAMNAIVNATTNFITYLTAYDPDAGNGNAQKLAFASWKNTYPNRYAYICQDPDPTPRLSVPASSSLGYLLQNNNDSGTCLISSLTDLNQPAFVAGAAASIDFQQQNGRITFAYKNQTGLVADVTTETAAVNLGGNPQQLGSVGNGYNYFGAIAAANQNFLWFQRGAVTGSFRWLDSYINMVWWTNLLQNALANFLATIKSVPFNVAGATLIEQALADPIQAGLNFGAAAPGTLSSAQIAIVNSEAGANIAGTLQTQGYYLQVLQQSAAVRANRGPWQITLWYLDRGAVQSIALNTVTIQ